MKTCLKDAKTTAEKALRHAEQECGGNVAHRPPNAHAKPFVGSEYSTVTMDSGDDATPSMPVFAAQTPENAAEASNCASLGDGQEYARKASTRPQKCATTKTMIVMDGWMTGSVVRDVNTANESITKHEERPGVQAYSEPNCAQSLASSTASAISSCCASPCPT